MFHLSKRLPALLALLALVLAQPRGVLILCSDGGGHLALEVATTSCRAGEAPVAAAGDACCTTDDCGPCRDTHLGVASEGARPSRVAMHHVAPAAPAPGAPALAIAPIVLAPLGPTAGPAAAPRTLAADGVLLRI